MADSLFFPFQDGQFMYHRHTTCARLEGIPEEIWRTEGKYLKRVTSMGCLYAMVAVFLFSVNLGVQEIPCVSDDLPNAPVPQTATAASANQGTASIYDSVADAQGAVILGSTVTLENAGSHYKRTTLSDGHGLFTFTLVEEGIFSITIQAKGFAPVVKTGLSLHTGENYQLTPTTMQVASAASTIEVGAQTQYELAESRSKRRRNNDFFSSFPIFT
jgi:hypothetical protein